MDEPGLGVQEMSVPKNEANMLVCTNYNTLPVPAQPTVALPIDGNTINVPIDEPEAQA